MAGLTAWMIGHTVGMPAENEMPIGNTSDPKMTVEDAVKYSVIGVIGFLILRKLL